MTFKEWAKDYFAKFPASEDTRREYTAAKAAWDAAHSVESVTAARLGYADRKLVTPASCRNPSSVE